METTIDFRAEAERLCKKLGVPCKTHRDYLANKLEMMYVKGKLEITKEFNKMRDNQGE